MKRLSKKFYPEHVAGYIYHNRTYLEYPNSKLLIKGYRFNTSTKECYAVLKRRKYILELIAVVSIIATIAITMSNYKRTQVIEFPDTIYYKDKYLSVNMNNSVRNKEVSVSILYKGTTIIDSLTLNPGESVGSINNNNNNISLNNGSYLCDVVVRIKLSKGSYKNYKFTVMLIVQ